MTFQAQEISRASGQPVELYDFVLGGTEYLLCTSSDPQTYAAKTYLPLEINREAVQVGPEEDSSLLQITMPSSHALVRQFINSVPGVLCSLTIRRVHKTDAANELYTLYKGIVRSVAFSDKGGVSQVGVMSTAGALARTIPRYAFTSLCGHMLFDRRCTINQNLFKFTGTASAVSSNQFTLTGLTASKGDGWATAGFAVSNLDYRLILSQSLDVLTLLLPFNNNVSGTSVDVFAGCDHSAGVCQSKFANGINFGGYPFVPTTNPFVSGLG